MKHWRDAQAADLTDMVARSQRQQLEPKTEGQRAYLDAVDSKKVTLCVGPAGTGKAQPLHSLIRVPNGWKRMDQMQVGDEVIAADGSISRVTGVFPSGVRPVYRLDFADGASAECCEEHLWRVYDSRYGRWHLVSLQELREMMKQRQYEGRLYVPLPLPERTPDVPLPLDPYLLGVLLGDGGLTNSVTLTTADEEVAMRVRSAATEYGCSLKKRTAPYCYQITGRRQKNTVLERLRSVGLYGWTSDQKFIPEIYLNASADQRRALLQGLMDTDGTVDRRGCVSYATTSLQLARQVQYIVRSLGGLAKLLMKNTTYTYKGEKKRGKRAYTIFIRHPDRDSLMCLSRKRTRCSGEYQYRNLRRRIDRISYVGEMPVQCIAIDHPDHLYVTNDFVVTHNTHIACGRGAHLLLTGRVKRLVLTRPLVLCGSGYGFLPGDKSEKVAPFFRPLLDILHEFIPPAEVHRRIADGSIELLPLEDMRGTTLRNTFLVCDEAQNAHYHQLHMLLTRYGPDSKFVVTGDISRTQVDVAHRGPNPLAEVVRRVEKNGGRRDVGVVRLTRKDIVRDGIVQWMDEALGDEPAAAWERFKCPGCGKPCWYSHGEDEGEPDDASCWACGVAVGLWVEDCLSPHLISGGPSLVRTFRDRG